VPSMLERTPAPMSEEKALEIRLPQKRIAFLLVSSRRVYHLERIMSAPGRKAASTKPRKKRVATMPEKPVVIPERVDTSPHMSMTAEM
jgi:hypothetical protein